jgi:hypothetical protein
MRPYYIRAGLLRLTMLGSIVYWYYQYTACGLGNRLVTFTGIFPR